MDSSLTACATIAAWYTLYSCLALVNKFLLSYYGLNQPVTLGLLHMVSCSFFTSAIKLSGVIRVAPVRSWKIRVEVTLLSTIAAVHLGLCFASFRYIPLSLIEEISATAALPTAVFGFFIAGTIESIYTYLTLIPVSAGIIVACGFEPSISWVGVALCLASVSLRGCINAIQGLIMFDGQDRLDSFSLLYHTSPLTVLWLLAASAFCEPHSISAIRALMHEEAAFGLLLLVNCGFAATSNLLTLCVIEMTSPLTLEVVSNGKGILVAALSVLLFHDTMPWRNCAGYAIVVVGAVSYIVSKARSPATRAHTRLSLFHQAAPSTLWELPSAANGPFGDVLASSSDGAACPEAGGLGPNSSLFIHSRRGCSRQDWTGRSACSAMSDEVKGDCVNVGGWGGGSPGGAGHREATISANDVDAPLLPAEAYGDR